ncbi:MAG: helix-turn-helix domain-containing protein [Oscillospiraceae bacterium]|nr:helix-turn-helix domain-containing protein [Oscillospiraceae bacterium]
MNEHDNSPLVLTVRQTAALLKLSIRSTYELCKRPDFPSLKLTPNRIGVSRNGLENWIAEQLESKQVGK